MLIYTKASLSNSATMSEAVHHFHDHPGNFAAVTHQGSFKGLIERNEVRTYFNDDSARSLFFNEPISFLIKPSSLMVNSDFELREVVQLFYSRSPERRNQDIVVLNNGRFEGLIRTSSVIDFLIQEWDQNLNSHLQPLPSPHKEIQPTQKSLKNESTDNHIIDGSLITTPPVQLIQLFGRHKETGCLEIYSPLSPIPQMYRIYFKKGVMVHALAPFQIGLEAIKKAKDLTKGRFRFVFGEISSHKTIPSYESLQTLLFSKA